MGQKNINQKEWDIDETLRPNLEKYYKLIENGPQIGSEFIFIQDDVTSVHEEGHFYKKIPELDYVFDLLSKEPIEQTPLQKQIEKTVTNGLGYDTSTQYTDPNSYDSIHKYNLIIGSPLHNIHNTPEGLRIHLAELDQRTNPSFHLEELIKLYKKLVVDIENLPFNEIFRKGGYSNLNNDI